MSDYNFKNYTPVWVEYEAIKESVVLLFKKVLDEKIIDVLGVFSQDGWEPDWPIVVQFESISISFQTKCDYLWSIDQWENYEFYETKGLPLKLTSKSITKDLDITSVLNSKLIGLYQITDCSNNVQAFILPTGKNSLKIFNAGDQLGIKTIDYTENHFGKSLI